MHEKTSQKETWGARRGTRSAGRPHLEHQPGRFVSPPFRISRRERTVGLKTKYQSSPLRGVPQQQANALGGGADARAGMGFNVYAIVSSIALALLLLYVGEAFPSIQQVLRSAGYLGTFVLGILYSHSFTSLPAAALLLLMAKSQNVWLAGTIATLGAVVGDLVVFALFRSAKGFADEHPKKTRYARWWAAVETKIPLAWQPFVMMAVVALFLLLPLPNEFTDYLLARTRKVTTSTVLLISYVLNGIGIYTCLWLARRG